MRFKILFVPLALASIIYIAIFLIKPDYASLQTKKQELIAKEAQVASMNGVLQNIDSLDQNLAQEKGKAEFLSLYIPEEVDQGRLIDAFNFLASQTGVVLSTLSITKIERKEAAEESLLGTSGALTSVNPGLGPVPDPAAPSTGVAGESAALMPAESNLATATMDSSAVAPGMPGGALPKAAIEAVEVELTVEGTYANIKNFLSRLSIMNRQNTVTAVNVAEKIQPGEATTSSADPVLTAIIGVNLDYVPFEKTAVSALLLPAFRKAQFDWQPLDIVMNRVNVLPSLEGVSGGKANPFSE